MLRIELESLRCRRNRWAVFNVIMLIVALGVVGTSTWALVEGIKTTDGKVNDFWSLIGSLQNSVRSHDACQISDIPPL